MKRPLKRVNRLRKNPSPDELNQNFKAIEDTFDDLYSELESSGSGTQILNGAGAPGAGLGNDGDYYLNTTTDEFYQKSAGTWSVIADFTGAAGANGSNGTNGADGADGAPGVVAADLPLTYDGGSQTVGFSGSGPLAYHLMAVSDSLGNGTYFKPGDFSKISYVHEDWTVNNAAGSFGWAAQTIGGAGGGVLNSTQTSQTEWGVVEVRSGTANGTGGAFHLGVNRFMFGTATVIWEAKVKMDALFVNGSNDGRVYVGWVDNTGADPNNGIIFDYLVSASPNWRIAQANGGSRSRTTTTVAVTTNWTKLRAVTTGTSTEFFIDGVSVGTISSDCPTASVSPAFGIMHGSNGSTQRVMYNDWWTHFAVWPSGR